MFSLFKKNKNEDSTNHHFRGFQDQFSENQRRAIMCSLFTIANSDGEFHKKEQEFFVEVASVLGYKLRDNYLDDFLSIGRDRLLNILNGLDENQKDWYIITAFTMIHIDGKALEIEFQYLESYFNSMGIDRNRFERVLQKSQLLMNKFM
jgi:uncharacterized tellurite resistance protein B-like protein